MSKAITMLLIGIALGVYGVLFGRWGKQSLARMKRKYPDASSSYRYRRFNIQFTEVVSIALSIGFVVAGVIQLIMGKH
jgi:hypothetical protein